MALNVKKIDKKNRADELIEQMEEGRRVETSVETTIASLSNKAKILNKIEDVNVEESIEEKSLTEDKRIPATDTSVKMEEDEGEIIEKKSHAGRKKMDEEKKKKRFTLTLSQRTIKLLEENAEGKFRSATNYVSEYVEEHIEEILRSY
jgi:3-phosphoglycerate kinase